MGADGTLWFEQEPHWGAVRRVQSAPLPGLVGGRGWTHVAVVRQGGVHTLWANGTLVAEGYFPPSKPIDGRLVPIPAPTPWSTAVSGSCASTAHLKSTCRLA